MSVDKSFIDKILKLAPADIHRVDFRNYSDRKLYQLTPPVIGNVEVHTLTAIVDFCRKELVSSGFQYLVHVASPGGVAVMSAADADYRQREYPVTAVLQAELFPFGRYIDTEHFVIALQSQFVQDKTTAAILALVGNLTTVAESRTLDDGVSQVVEARVGLSKRETVVVPNPVQLAPFRTFVEVEQPVSNFVFRINAKDHSCALYEADGGAWKNAATARIKEILVKALSEFDAGKIFTVLA